MLSEEALSNYPKLCAYIRSVKPKGDVPVPGVYGWRTEGNGEYIYMEYVYRKSLGHTCMADQGT